MSPKPSVKSGRTSRRELETMIRFALESLGESNSHHEFELLCLELARRRVASNLLPSTGPVSAGGDGGADAQSFWTSIASAHGAGTAIAATESVVVACTTQKLGLRSKILDDAQKAAHLEPDVIVFFLASAMSAKRRQEVIGAASAKVGKRVEIWEGRAIAHELADEDLHDLVADFLHIPPQLLSLDSTNRSSRGSDVRSRKMAHFGDLAEARAGLRRAVESHDSASRQSWLRKLAWIVQTGPDLVAGRAIPALVFGHAATRETLTGVEKHIERHLSLVGKWMRDGTDLIDALALLRVVSVATTLDRGSFAASEVKRWQSILAAVLNTRIEQGTSKDLELVLIAGLHLLPDPSIVSDSQETDSLRVSIDGTLTNLVAPPQDAATALDFLEMFVTSPERGVRSVQLAIEFFENSAPHLATSPRYALIRDGLDEMAERIEGSLAIEHNSLFRALRLAQSSNFLAVREGRRAFSRSTGDPSGAANAALVLASNYWNLDMPAAAMYFALATAALAGNNDAMNIDRRVELLRDGLSFAAASTYRSGWWILAADTMKLVFAAAAHVDVHNRSAISRPLMEAVRTHSIAAEVIGSHRPNLLPFFRERSGLAVEPPAPKSSRRFKVSAIESETSELLKAAGMFSPLGDAGLESFMEWDALGVHWILRSSSSREDSLALLEIAAHLQMTAVEMADWELDVVGTSVFVEVRTAQVVPERERFLPTRVGEWLVTVPENERDLDVISVSVMLISSVVLSPLSDEIARRLMESTVQGVAPPFGGTFADLLSLVFRPERVWPEVNVDLLPLAPSTDSEPPLERPRMKGIPASVARRSKLYWQKTHPKVELFVQKASEHFNISTLQRESIVTLIDEGWKPAHITNAVGLVLLRTRLSGDGFEQLLSGNSLWVRELAKIDASNVKAEDLPSDFKPMLCSIAQVWAAQAGLSMYAFCAADGETILAALSDRFDWKVAPANDSLLPDGWIIEP